MKEYKTNLAAQLAGCFMLIMFVLLAAHYAGAQVVFDSASTNGGTVPIVNGSGQQSIIETPYQFGDEVVLDLGTPPVDAFTVSGYGTSVVLTNFEFEYYVMETNKSPTTHLLTGPAWKVDLKFYANDGPQYGTNTDGTPFYTPGTLLYDSTPVSISGPGTLGFNTLDFNLTNSTFKNGGVLVPLDFTWTVTFGGGATNIGNTYGLPLFTLNSPGTAGIGTDYTEYWENTNGGWADILNTNGEGAFGAQATAGATNDTTLPSVTTWASSV